MYFHVTPTSFSTPLKMDDTTIINRWLDSPNGELVSVDQSYQPHYSGKYNNYPEYVTAKSQEEIEETLKSFGFDSVSWHYTHLEAMVERRENPKPKHLYLYHRHIEDYD